MNQIQLELTRIAEQDDLELTGDVPVELQRLLAGFFTSNKSNSCTAEVCGKQKHEVGQAKNY